MHTRPHHITYGFSLVELMVALSIFSIVMTASVGTLITLIDANAKAQALSEAITNLTFALDSMTRNVRMGTDYYCTSANSLNSSLPKGNNSPDCSGTNGNTALIFSPDFAGAGARMAYRISNGVIEQRIERPSSDTGWIPITNSEGPGKVEIETLRFFVNGARGANDTDDATQSQASVLISGTVGAGRSDETEFQIQSRVTQRVLDY